MATTVAQIADKALAAVAASVTDAVITVTLVDPSVDGAWNPTTGEPDRSESSKGSFSMVIDNAKPIGDAFPDYVAGPGESLVFLRGDTVPEKGWELRGGPRTYVVIQVQDILGSGAIFYAVVR